MCNATTTNFIIAKCTDYAMSRECEMTTIGLIIIGITIALIANRYKIIKLTKSERLK